MDERDVISVGDAQGPPSKKQRLNDGGAKASIDSESMASGESGDKASDPALLEVAKKRLSKWAARLFDPNRIRGLIEPPSVIPLNDEFLQAFGKREKEFDSKVGRTLDIDTSPIPDVEDDNKDSNDDDKEDQTPIDGRKVKMTNLKYSTSAEALNEVCKGFGPVVEVNLIMDPDTIDSPTPLNVGRAYVTFQTEEAAKKCVDTMKAVDGRVPRVLLAEEAPKKKNSTAASRYWQKDISTKCFRCGEVGHILADCMNEVKPRACPLCAKTDHEMRACPVSRVCFNCGLPGHVSRECMRQRGQPPRRVCSTCFQSGHHRIACRNFSIHRQARAYSDAICMDCGRKGHFLCKDFTFFFGLEGVSCFNCGMRGHLGYECTRPNLEDLSRDDTKAAEEIEKAESTLFEDLEKELVRLSARQHRSLNAGGRNSRDSHHMHQNDHGRNRSKSVPPQPPRRESHQQHRNWTPPASRHSSSNHHSGQRSNQRGYDAGYDRSRGNNRNSSNNRRGYNSYY